MLTLILETYAALYEAPSLRHQVITALSERITDPSEKRELSVARQVVQLDPTRKIAGIKILRDALQLGLKRAKDLWEVAASLEGFPTHPGF